MLDFKQTTQNVQHVPLTLTIQLEMELAKHALDASPVVQLLETVSPAMLDLKSMELIVRPVPLILTILQQETVHVKHAPTV
jgi:hypothetical protein